MMIFVKIQVPARTRHSIIIAKQCALKNQETGQFRNRPWLIYKLSQMSCLQKQNKKDNLGLVQFGTGRVQLGTIYIIFCSPTIWVGSPGPAIKHGSFELGLKSFAFYSQSRRSSKNENCNEGNFDSLECFPIIFKITVYPEFWILLQLRT